MLITPGVGSFTLLGTLLVDLELPADEPPLVNDASAFPHLNCRVRIARGNWQRAHERQLREADGVILIGGNPTGVSISVGKQCIERGLTFLPVPIFDGAGSELWNEHNQQLTAAGVSSDDVERMGDEFDSEVIVRSLLTMINRPVNQLLDDLNRVIADVDLRSNVTYHLRDAVQHVGICELRPNYDFAGIRKTLREAFADIARPEGIDRQEHSPQLIYQQRRDGVAAVCCKLFENVVDDPPFQLLISEYFNRYFEGEMRPISNEDHRELMKTIRMEGSEITFVDRQANVSKYLLTRFPLDGEPEQIRKK